MPYPGNHLLFTAGGHFGSNASPIEQWRASIKFAAPTGQDYSLTQRNLFLTDVQAAVSTFHSATQWKNGPTTFLKRLTLAHIGPDGKYVGGGNQVTAEYIYATGVAGSAGASNPYSQAVVITLRTSMARGRASHGRLYWPCLGQSVDSTTGLLPVTTCQSMVSTAKVLFDALNTASKARFGEGSFTVVASPLGNGTVSYVTRIGIGQKLDRQERREKDLLENHQFAALASPPSDTVFPNAAPTPAGPPQY